MAQRIRNFDWSRHPFGEPEYWPQSLKSALGICLHSAFPTAIYWGSELRLLYNDAWSLIPGPRHPGCLGEPAKEVWSDIWHVIEPQFSSVIRTGEGFFTDDQLLPMRRYGFEEETYWSYSLTPIRGEDGAIEGIFNSGQETTAKVLKHRQTTFLLNLIDATRAGSDAVEMMWEGCRLLGEHLGAIRAGIREVDGDGQHIEWAAEGVDKAGSEHPWASQGPVARQLRDGHAVRIDRLDGLTATEARALSELGARSVLAVPWLRSGELSAVLFVHRAETQPWTDDEIATAEQVFARLIQAIDQERAAARERTLLDEIDHRARNMLGVSQALVRMTPAEDVENFRQSLLERMRALGNTLQVLSESQWVGADLHAILRKELEPFVTEVADMVSIDGPTVMVPPSKAQPVSMAMHEMVTNSVKYGALSGSGGRLEISWVVGPDGIVELDWVERDVRPVAAARNVNSGFGTKLLEMTIETQLGGAVAREVGEGVFRCRLELPLSEGG